MTRAAGLAPLLIGLQACAGASPYALVVSVVDEGGDPLPDATVEVDGEVHAADRHGEVRLRGLDRPVVAVVSAPGMLTEPAQLGRRDAGDPVVVRLLSDQGGTRLVTHFAGDAMLGRRYTTPDEGEPLLVEGDEASARDLVASLSVPWAQAGLRALNLETVVGTFPEEDAYPAKRWLLQTRPEHLAALDALPVDVVGLANNHQRDWLDDGVASTLDALDAWGLPRLGGGLDAADATAPVMLEAGGLTVGMIGWTSVDGAYVNDQYPTDADVAPDEVSEDEAWKWEAREWGEPDLGVEVAERRIGGAWTALEDALSGLDEVDQAALWSSAEAVYPELQDWVARYGHGGAAVWDDDASPAAIAALAEDVDVVVVQLHMGFQFSESPGSGVKDAARAAIDAGADLVVCHHPHVLQGFEWYQGHLIAYSLGNFIFEQNFLSTFPSGFLRVVWNGDGSVEEARFVPAMLHAYRPLPVADSAAGHVLRTVWDRSLIEGQSLRGDDLGVRTVAEPWPDGASPPGMAWEWGTARLTADLPEIAAVDVALPAEGIAALPSGGLVRSGLSASPPADVEVGAALFGLGSFEDDDTDDIFDDPIGWTWSSDDVSVTTRRVASGERALQLVRGPDNSDVVLARTTARVPFLAHRLWADEDGDQPLDGDLRLSVALSAWVDGEADLGSVRLVLYHFDDLDPTEDPESTVVSEVTLPFEIDGAGWQDLVLDVPDDALEAVDGLSPNAALVYVELAPPEVHTTVLRVDDVELIGWRSAASQPDGWSALRWARATDGVARTIAVDVLPWE